MADKSICKIEGCDKPAYKRDWCQSHYKRWWRHGDPLAGGTQIGEPERYLREIVLAHEGEGCLTWPFSRNYRGYGIVRLHERRFRRVHRIVCEQVNGPAPTPEHEAAHSCGNGHLGCVHPAHLSWKTHAGNMADMAAHGSSPRGERSYRAKLTEGDVREIRALRGVVTQAALAGRFGVREDQIGKIQRRQRWAWLE